MIPNVTHFHVIVRYFEMQIAIIILVLYSGVAYHCLPHNGIFVTPLLFSWPLTLLSMFPFGRFYLTSHIVTITFVGRDLVQVLKIRQVIATIIIRTPRSHDRCRLTNIDCRSAWIFSQTGTNNSLYLMWSADALFYSKQSDDATKTQGVTGSGKE